MNLGVESVSLEEPASSYNYYTIILLNFVHRLNYKIIKLQRFRGWILEV
jgi:hypothetical protein